MQTWPGSPYPLGATWDGKGVNFALFSEHAVGVELCLYHPGATEAYARVPVLERTDLVWHVYLPDARPGLHYGYRVYGPWRPEEGLRFNAHKLVLDPYGKGIHGQLRFGQGIFGHDLAAKRDADLHMDTTDSGPQMLRSVVIEGAFDWGESAPPRTPWHETVIYELHVRGFTIRHPDIPPSLRGTYLGLASEPAIAHLKSLGVTAVELMPIHSFLHEPHLMERGHRNYWGYHTLGFFSPHLEYAAANHPEQALHELKTMVKALHQAGIEVILDVVYNHTAEGDQRGPTLCFRGIDNPNYYRLVDDNERYYMDFSGCGNTLDMRRPRTLQFMMDSLRYWVEEVHIDGFRFDLASALARGMHSVSRAGVFFDTIRQDPVLSQVKLIAEPWDIGADGYLVGGFPPGWAEWNGRYRDTVRDYWRGVDQRLSEFAYRLTGSSDLYESSGRKPYASINFITAHDGFTLADLVTYNHKHNDENAENGSDGHDDNRSWNCGTEGPTADPTIAHLRERQRRNLMATLLLSQGVPMLSHGDEIGRTQRGNNNAYCQDNPLTWLDWEHVDESMLTFTRELLAFRRRHPVFHRRRWFQGRAIHGSLVHDIAWFAPSGEEMNDTGWRTPFARALGVFLDGATLSAPGPRGEHVEDDSFFLLFNAHDGALSFRLPPGSFGRLWQLEFDTAAMREASPPVVLRGASTRIDLCAHSLAVMRRVA